MRVPRWAQFLAVFLLASFAWVSLSETYVHHHKTQTEEQDCAYCQFHKVLNSSDLIAEPASLAPLFLVFAVLSLFTPAVLKVHSVVHPGRAPPQNLL